MLGMEGSVIVSKVKDGKNDFGFNAKTEEFENMMKSWNYRSCKS